MQRYDIILNVVSVTYGKDANKVKAKSAAKTAGEDDPEFEATVTGLINTDSFDYTVYRTDTSEEVGKHTGVLNVRLNREYPNYDISITKADFTINEDEFATIKQNFSVTDYEGTYDGKEHYITVKGDLP